MAKKSGKNVYLVALLLFLGGVGYLAYSGFSENSVYFLNVSEALATPSDKLKAARLFGTVAEDGLSRSETGRDVKFRLEDQENKATTLWVEYTGAIPDTFKAGAEVIVEGGSGLTVVSGQNAHDQVPFQISKGKQRLNAALPRIFGWPAA